jgi:hypothetical protein
MYRGIPPHDGQGLPDIDGGRLGSLCGDAQLGGVEDSDVTRVVQEDGVLHYAAESVQAGEKRIFKTRLIQVSHVVGVIATAAMPVTWQRRKQHFLGWRGDAEERDAVLHGSGEHLGGGRDQGPMDVLVATSVPDGRQNAVFSYRIEGRVVQAPVDDGHNIWRAG